MKKDESPKIELVAKPHKKDLWGIFVKDNGIVFDSQHGGDIFWSYFRLNGRN